MDALPASALAKSRQRNSVQIHPMTAAPTGEGLADTRRKLWRQRRMIATLTVLLSGVAAIAAWSIPPSYSAEARVLVDVHSQRVFNAEAILTDAGLDAEWVQNEGFVLQSRTLAKLVIDKLQLADNPAFNPELRPPSFWTLAFSLDHLLPDQALEWLDQWRTKPVVPAAQQADRLRSARDNRLIDILLSKIDVSLLGRSHVLSVKAEAQEPNLAASIANTLAEIYLDGQRRERVAMLQRTRQGSGTEENLQSNARLVSPAAPPESPAYPPRPLLAFLGATGGLLLACAFALLREGADPTFRRADQVEAITGLPVLAMVPQVPTRTPPSIQVLRQPTSTYSEALRRLQIGIELSKAGSAPRTVLFSSATASEGKSVIVSSLARLMASNGRRILVIDCDRRSPHQHQIFRCPLGEGLAGLLADKAIMLEDILYHDALSGVDVLSAGSWSPRQAHLLTSPRMRQLLDALAPHYDQILLDTAPALATADVLALSRMVEKVVFVVRWAHTRQEAALEALNQIAEAQGDVAGVVLSRVVPRRHHHQHGHRYPFYEHPAV
jgi:capsular exopolysaccharide synthesis family protein